VPEALRLERASAWLALPDGGRANQLHEVDWAVGAGEHWAVLGPNGAGKSTLLSLAAAARYPSRGVSVILGERLGRTDVAALRRRIGLVDEATASQFWPNQTVAEIVLTGASGTILLVRSGYRDDQRERAAELLELVDCTRLAGRTLDTLSQGERQRVLIARALVPDPDLLLLDEPATGLDLGARERLLATIEQLAAAHPSLATVTVTHHVEELPRTASHALLLRAGRVVASGPVTETLTPEALSRCFGVAIEVGRADGRWHARARIDAAGAHW
jgi:iron complex transport system ATP-binding protein